MLLVGVFGATQQTTDDPPGRFGAFLEQLEARQYSGPSLVYAPYFGMHEGERTLLPNRNYFEYKGVLEVARWEGSRKAVDRFRFADKEWHNITGLAPTCATGSYADPEWPTVKGWFSALRAFIVAPGRRGELVVTLSDDMSSISRFDRRRISGDSSIGSYGGAPGQFRDVRGLALDPSHRLWILDRVNCLITVLDPEFSYPWSVPEGNQVNADVEGFAGSSLLQLENFFDLPGVWSADIIKVFGSRGQGPGQFSYPTDLDIHGDRVYVTDRGNHRIQVFDLEGKYLYEWGIHSVEPGDGEGKLHYPESLAISSDGTVAVVHEPLLGRLQAFGLTDEPAEKFMTDPVTLTGLGGHMGPRFSVHGSKVAVFDPEAQRVQLYDTGIASVPIKVTEFGGAGTGSGQFMDLVDLTFDERGDLWVLDRGTRSVAQLRADYGKELKGFDARLMSMVRRFDLEALAGERESWCDWPDRLEWLEGGLWIGQGSSRWRLERPAGERRWVLGPDSPQGPPSMQPELDRASWEWNLGSAQLGRHDLRKPTDAQWVGDDLWVLDFGHHRLLRYDSTGAVIAAIGPPSYTRPALRSAPAPRPVTEEE